MRKLLSTGRLVVTGLLLSFVVMFVSLGDKTGRTGRTLKSSTAGCDCHTKNTAVVATITAPTTMAPGETAACTLKITGGPLITGGCDIAVSTGTLVANDAYLKLSSSELTHSTAKPVASSAITFLFNYKAPTTTGSAIIYAVGNSCNNNNGESGDGWNYAPNKTITIQNASATGDDNVQPLAFALEQNYPNPFNPSTLISYSVAKDEYVTLKVYNVSGQEVDNLVSQNQVAGKYSATFHGDNLPSGIYICKLQAGSSVAVRKMALMK